MEILTKTERFLIDLVELPISLDVQVYKIINGVIPITYGQIMNDIVSSGDNLDAISFSGQMFEEIMETKHEFFKNKLDLNNKIIYFLRKCGVRNTYHWVEILEWNKRSTLYALSEHNNANDFYESWMEPSKRECIFFTINSK